MHRGHAKISHDYTQKIVIYTNDNETLKKNTVTFNTNRTKCCSRYTHNYVPSHSSLDGYAWFCILIRNKIFTLLCTVYDDL